MKFCQNIKSVILIWSMFFGSVLHTSDLNENSVYLSLKNEAEELNKLINEFLSEGSLGISQQKKFAENLSDFKNKVKDLKAQDVEVGGLEQNYIKIYDHWAYKIINQSSLLDQIDQAGKDDSIDAAYKNKVTQLCEDLKNIILAKHKEFDNQIDAKLANLGSYSKISQKSLLKLLHDEYDAFYVGVQTAKTAIKNTYFSFLMEQDPNFNVTDLTNEDKKFVQGIDKIANDAIIFQKEFMLDFTSQQLEKNRILNLAESLKNTKLLNEQMYQAQLAINEAGLQRSWWEELFEYGKDFLQDFSQEFKKELTIQTNKAIVHVGGKLAGEIGRGVIKPVAESLSAQVAKFGITIKTESLENFFKDLSPAARAVKKFIRAINPVLPPDRSVVVKTDISLSDAEQKAVANRMKRISAHLKSEFKIEQPLRMAICCSGGGVRAMIGTMGIFQAASRTKILQSCLYMVGLSGSTWMIAPWSYWYLKNKAKLDYDQSLQKMVDNWKIVLNDNKMVQVGSKICTPANLENKQAAIFSAQIAVQLAYGAPITAVDVYGAMVGNFALSLAGDDRLKIDWSSIAQPLINGEIPLPLCSAVFDGVLPENRFKKNNYEWCEFSPFEVGGTKIGYIPLQYLGSTFVNNKLDTSEGQLRPSYSLSFILGVCGSAFGINLNDVINKTLPSMIFKIKDQKITLPIDMWVRSTLDESFGQKGRFKRGDSLYALFANYSIDNSESVLQHQDMFELVDAGIAFNIPLPLISDRTERAVDVIIMYDSNPVDMGFFTDAAVYYKKLNAAPMPDFSQATRESLQSKVMTVFNDPRDIKYDKTKPTLLYFPTMVNIKKPPYITTNFKYKPEELQHLIDKTSASFSSQIEDIKKIMKLVANYRYS